jgi:sugar phosphate isomerase/epimerase
MAGDYNISDIYQGGYSSLAPSYGNVFTGYKVNAGSLGLTTDPRTANVLQEASKNIATGIKQIEISAVQPEIFESIPSGKEFNQFKELKRLSKLTGVDISVHAPIVEASGLTKEGFTEANRKAAERQMTSAVEKSHEINPQGNIPVTFHSSAMLPGQVKEKGKKPEEMIVINQETGQINRIPIKKEKHFPGDKEISVEKELQRINEESWSQELSHLSYNTQRTEEYIKEYGPTAIVSESEERQGRELNSKQKAAKHAFGTASSILNDAYREFKGIYEKAYANATTDEDKEKIRELGEKISQKVSKVNDTESKSEAIMLKQEVIEDSINTLNDLNIPQTYVELNDFAKEKTIQTFANVAFDSYKKFKDNAPIISIENPPIGGAFATGEELKEIVEKARKKFIERAVEEGLSKSQAKEAAQKVLGVTWDVGHINMLRKYGYKAKDIIKETEAVAPLVKHIHLSDNFGFEHTELPMGMGNVPLKEILDKLGKEGFDAKKIIEAGNWWQHFKTPPFKETLQALGSSIYSMDMAPYWNQTLGLQQGYIEGYGMMLPQVHYETFGAGFSQLPTELGGQRPGAEGSRMSGRQME